jgi:hypothetical protein
MKWRRALLAAFFVLAGAGFGHADDDAGTIPTSAPVTDPAQVAAHYREVVGRSEFQEPAESDVNDQMRSWLSQCFARFGAKLDEFRYAEEMPRFTSLLITLLVGASLIGLLYVLVRLTRRRIGRDFSESTTPPGPKIFQPPEFYEEELRRAVAGGDWHAAWLASWRQFLSRLEKGQLVAADRSRTNREYLLQLRAQLQTEAALPLVSGTVEAYDAFIYGRRAIAEPDWRSFQGKLDEAGLLLHLTDRPATTTLRAA